MIGARFSIARIFRASTLKLIVQINDYIAIEIFGAILIAVEFAMVLYYVNLSDSMLGLVFIGVVITHIIIWLDIIFDTRMNK